MSMKEYICEDVQHCGSPAFPLCELTVNSLYLNCSQHAVLALLFMSSSGGGVWPLVGWGTETDPHTSTPVCITLIIRKLDSEAFLFIFMQLYSLPLN